MKHLILAAGLSLIAVPAFAASIQETAGQASLQTATTATTQQHTYSYNSDAGSSSAIEARNARLQRNAAERSPNAKAAWAGQAHFY